MYESSVILQYKLGILFRLFDDAHFIIATARVLPKATQRELFRLGAYSRYWQSHY